MKIKKMLVAALMAGLCLASFAANLKVPTPKATRGKYSYVKVTWSKVSKAKGYYVYRSTSSSWKSASRLKKLSGASKVSYKDKSAKAGKTYYYWVCPYNSKYYYSNASRYASGYVKSSSKTSSKSSSITGNTKLSVARYNVYRLKVNGLVVTSGVRWSYSGKATAWNSTGGICKLIADKRLTSSSSKGTLKAVYKGKTYSKTVTIYKSGSYGDGGGHPVTTYSGYCSRHGHWTSSTPSCPYCKGEIRW